MMTRLPLDGIRVLELANFMAGPFCGMLLADMGAEVVKVENPRIGDYTRENPPFVNGESAGFMALNRNKRSVALNLKADRGRELFLELARTADVILENFRPGTMADLGIDEAAVKRRNPRIVYASVSGFGQTGPYSQRPGLDLVLQGMSGLMSLTGEPDGAPVKVGVPLCDLTAALFTAFAIVSSLRARDRDGEGEYVDVSLFEAGVALEIWETSAYFAAGTIPVRMGSAHRVTAPYRAYRTADGYVTIGAQTPGLWPKLCEVLGRPELVDDPRFDSVVKRVANEPELAAVIEVVTTREPTAAWYRRLEEAGVPAGPLNTLDQVMADEHLRARGFVVEQEHPTAGRVRNTGTPMHLRRTPIERFHAAPTLGQHTEQFLREIGLSEAEVAELRANGVIL